MNTVYHYCPQAAFIEVVKNKRIWATSIRGMNDPTEGIMINDHMTDELKALGVTQNGKRLEVINKVVQAKANYLITSLTKKGDDLSQWRAYASNGEGFSIGLDVTKLQKIVLSIGGRCEEVKYDKNTAAARVKEIMKGYKSSGSNATLIEELTNEALLTKSTHYKDEDEVRLIFDLSKLDKAIVDYRITPYGIMPYAKIDVSDAISECIIGPRNHSTRQNVVPFLEKYGHAAKTKPSKISYR